MTIRINMRMPKDCAECPMLLDTDECCLSPKIYKTWDEQYADCPLEDAASFWHEEDDHIWCDRCTMVQYYDDNLREGEELYDYCPECGAKMDKEHGI